MRITAVHFDPLGTVESTTELLRKIPPGTGSALIMSCDGNPITADEWKRLLPQFPCVFFGGIFPQVIHADRHFERGTVIVGFESKLSLVRIGGLNDSNADLDQQIVESLSQLNDAQSVLIWVDGLSQRISDLLESVYDRLGARKMYMGGGAGSLSFQPKPSVFYNQTLLQGEAVLAPFPTAIDVGVEHGWQKLAGPFNITRSVKNCIHAIDYKEAFQVYRETISSHSEKPFSPENFFEIAKGFPFGIEHVDGSLVVRDPITTDGKTLTCVGEVPENSIVYILKGGNDALIQAAQLAAKKANPRGGVSLGLVVDCISRVLFLGSDFQREITVASDGFLKSHVPLIGALTLGEIANDGGHALQFYNKTFVIGGFKSE